MKVLYVAPDIPLSEPHGGPVHVREVASGLARLGRTVRVVTKGSPGESVRGAEDGFEIRRTLFHVPGKLLRFCSLPAVAAEVRDFRPDVIIERYYNFGGEGVLAGTRRGVPAVLEVNSPMVEYAGSTKQRIDRVFGSPLERWREWLARNASGFITPTRAILPDWVPEERIHVLPWGANVDSFSPSVAPASVVVPSGRTAVAFVSSFRAWHGALAVVEAAKQLREEGAPAAFFLMIGEGPERDVAERRARELGLADDFLFSGSVPYAEIPSYLRLAKIGVAPFEPRRHSYLQIDFFWRPLKIVEYMASELPVVTIDVPALREIVRPEIEGLLYPEGDAAALASALRRLLEDPEAAQRMGRAARERVVDRYSWQSHCASLAEILDAVVAGRAA